MAYRRFGIAALAVLFVFLLGSGCGRSDLTNYIWGEGGVDGGDGGACSPTTCPTGCCDPSGQCRTGTEFNACGFGGLACADCQKEGDDFCDPQVKACGSKKQTCDATTCGSGCCTTFQGSPACVSGTSTLACGNGGAACINCAMKGEACNPATKACVSAPCGPNDCLGCCAGSSCVPGQSNTQCGSGGLSCTDCTTTGELCNPSNGQCQKNPPVCGPMNCNGCCAGDVCVTSEGDTQCGVGGVACTDCTASGESCSGGTCVTTCNTTTCKGCCDTGVCTAGFVDTACGSGGAVCADCTMSSETCDTLAVPRVCTGTTSTCPATYGGCGSGVTTATLSVTSGACNSTDLANAAAACKTGEGSAPCQSFISIEPGINAACATCLTPFYYALNDGTGIFNCVSPYVSSTCNHNTGCIDDCENQSCDKCPSGSVQSCLTSVQTSQCATYWSKAGCVATALFGAANFCSPTTYGGNYGAWLAGVGGHYCL